MTMNPLNPVEANTPLQPAPPWTDGVSAQTQLGNDGIKQYSQSGVLIPNGTVATDTADVYTDVSFEAQLILLVKVASASGGANVTVQINGKTADGETYPILTSAALGSVAVTPLRVGTGFTAVTNLSANDMLPSDLQIVCTVANGSGAISYGVELIIG
jgi:hypothetical protein